MQHAAEHVGGARDGGDAAFTLDARAEQFEIECAFIAGAEHPFEHRADRDGAVAWHGAARHRAIAVDVITDLDDAVARYGALDRRTQARLAPAAEQVDADAESGHLGKRSAEHTYELQSLMRT